MCTLIVIDDPLSGTRHEYGLRVGEPIAEALMRQWPEGIDGAWRIYRDSINDGNEIPAVDLPYTVPLAGETYIIVRDMAGALPFLGQVFLAIWFSALNYILTPKPKPAYFPSPNNEPQSGNNNLAAQANQIRLGARIPDILGTVRSFPDLLCRPIETFWVRTQNINQYFVIGRGDYEVPPELVKLGETPRQQINGATYHTYHPHDTADPIPSIPAVRTSPEVGGISLVPDDSGPAPFTGVDFNGPAKTMTSDDFQDLNPNNPITISGTNDNNGLFWLEYGPEILPGPPWSPPYVWQLDGPVITELDTNAEVAVWDTVFQQSEEWVYFGTTSPYTPTPTAQDIRVTGGDRFAIGDVVQIYSDDTALTSPIKGTVVYALNVNKTVSGIPSTDQIIRIKNVNNVVITPTPSVSENNASFVWYLPPTLRAGVPGTLTDPPPDPTSWYTAPMENPDEVWVDIAFPQGLHIPDVPIMTVRIEFKRADATDFQAFREFEYPYHTLSPLRFTHTFDVTLLGLPAGSPWIQVRCQRLTPFLADPPSDHYIQDTQWARLCAVRFLEQRQFDDVTIGRLALSNSRNQVAMGETSLNMVVTRRLPHWHAGVWSEPVATNRWADNFVARCKADDGARRPDQFIDLAGIYALQDQLDAIDGGDAGAIGMTLDQVQDVDTELAAIADVVRAVVYRVGRKIFVTRDQANATRIALFNSRTKGTDGETVGVRMTGDAENDCIIIPWVDAANSYKRRDYTYAPPGSLQIAPARTTTVCANWAQAFRRALYEWNRLKYRREQISVSVTEDGRICRPGDVVNITDDVANLAQSAGEVLFVDGAVLTLDRNVTFAAGSYTVLLRDVQGQTTDAVPCVAVVGSPNKVQLSRAPTVTIKGRDATLGTLFAFYDTTTAVVRPWLLTGVEASGPYVALTGVNYAPKVYDGDTVTLDPPPPLSATISARHRPPTGGAP